MMSYVMFCVIFLIMSWILGDSFSDEKNNIETQMMQYINKPNSLLAIKLDKTICC